MADGNGTPTQDDLPHDNGRGEHQELPGPPLDEQRGRSLSPRQRSPDNNRRDSRSPVRPASRSQSPPRRSPPRRSYSKSPVRASARSPVRSPVRERSLSPRKASLSPRKRSPSPKPRSPVRSRSRGKSPVRARSPVSRGYDRSRRSRSRERRRSRTPPRRERSRERRRSRSRDRYRRASPRRRSPSPIPSYGAPRRTPPPAYLHLFVAGLNFICNERDLQEKFTRYGAVKEARIVRNGATGESRGFGFVVMADEAGVKEAIRRLDGSDWNGRRLLVERARNVK